MEDNQEGEQGDKSGGHCCSLVQKQRWLGLRHLRWRDIDGFRGDSGAKILEMDCIWRAREGRCQE